MCFCFLFTILCVFPFSLFLYGFRVLPTTCCCFSPFFALIFSLGLCVCPLPFALRFFSRVFSACSVPFPWSWSCMLFRFLGLLSLSFRALLLFLFLARAFAVFSPFGGGRLGFLGAQTVHRHAGCWGVCFLPVVSGARQFIFLVSQSTHSTDRCRRSAHTQSLRRPACFASGSWVMSAKSTLGSKNSFSPNDREKCGGGGGGHLLREVTHLI